MTPKINPFYKRLAARCVQEQPRTDGAVQCSLYPRTPMLCCVSRRAIAGADLGPSYDYCLVKGQPVESDKVIEIVESKLEPDVPAILLPCAICARTFMPQSLGKHTKICESSANKKRKPFDSAKQRIQGTELAEFLPRHERKRHSPDDKSSSKSKSAWKQTHDDFLRAVRAARNELEVDPTMQKQGGTTATPNAPTRANEQGMCPTCNRHFGVKAYDRHVAWCKDRIVRVSASPATNIAKERLEARMKYRAPSVKNRRQTTREKYSPGSAVTLGSGNKTSPTLAVSRAKESASAPNCKTSDSPVKQKIAVVRRPGHQRESSCPTAPMKSRPVDRGYRPPEDEAGPVTFRPPAPPVKRTSYLPVPPLKHKKDNLEECNDIPSLTSIRKPLRRATEKVKRDVIPRQKARQDERHQALHSARSQTANIVSARSLGNPKINDVSINEDIMGVTVKPCNIHRENKYTTWKQISQEKDKDCLESNYKNGNSEKNVKPRCLPATSSRFLDLNTEHSEDLSLYKQQVESIDVALGENVFKEATTDLSLYEQQLKNVDAVLDEESVKEETSDLNLESESINWPPTSLSLNRTYSFRDTAVDDVEIVKCKKWKPVRHSPRVEFCFGDPEKMSHVSPISFNYADNTNLISNSRGYTKNVKEKNVQRESLKNSVPEPECVLNELGFEEQNLNFRASSLETELESEQFKSSKNRILMSYDEASPKNNCEDDAQNPYSNAQTMDTQKYLDENSMTTNVLNNKSYMLEEDNSLNCITSEIDIIEESKAEVLTENLQPSTSFEQFACLDRLEDFCETSEPEWNNNIINNDVQVLNESISDNNRLKLEMNEIVNVKNLEIENPELDSENGICTQSVQNGVEYPVQSKSINDNQMFCTDETKWIEMESNAFLAKSMLQPTRSSTPFISEEPSSNPKCNHYENFKRELCPPPGNTQWKVEVDTETGSEMLYRIERRDSDCPNPKLSSGGKIDKLENADSDNDTIQTRMPLYNEHVEVEKSVESMSRCISPSSVSRIGSTVIEEQEGNFSTFASSTMQQVETETSTMVKKEIASQINICNCSLELSSSYNRSKEEVEENFIDLDQNTCSENQACGVFLNGNVEDNETVEKSVETQAQQNIEESTCNSNPDESLTNLEESKHNDEGKHMNTRDHDNKNNPPKDFAESMVKTESTNEDVEEIYKNCSKQDFDCDSDNSIEHHIKDAISGLKSCSNKSEKPRQNMQNLRSYVLSESCVKMSQRVQVDDSSTNRSTALSSRRLKRLQMEHRIHESTSFLNESSDSLASSMDAPDVKQIESVEVETIEEIGTRNRSIRFKILPEIRGTTLVVKENYNEKEKIDTQTYWEKASKASRNRLINLDPPYQGASRFLKRNPKVRVLPPVPSSSSLIKHRDIKLPLRPVWSNYVRRRPDFNLVLSGRTGKDYDPFMLAEQQMNDLLSDTSEHSVTDSPSIEQNHDPTFPLSHSSAFVKYPGQSSHSNPSKRSSLIAPPTEFDDLTSDFSSDTTETNSLSREVFLKDLKVNDQSKEPFSKPDLEKRSPVRELGRRVIIDKSKALGKGVVDDDPARGSRSFVGSSERARKILDKVSPKVVRPTVNRSVSVRAASAPKATPDRKTSNNSQGNRLSNNNNDATGNLNGRNNNYANLSGSNLSLSSIVSSDVDIKRSNSVFDELMTSFEDENGSFASLKSLLKNDPLSSPAHGRHRNGQISDEELSSPESCKRQEHGKMSADSAYSSLNRKYSHHGRSANDVAGRFDEDGPRNNRREGTNVATMPKCKMSKFCHECGSKFTETAKFCCECGFRRLVL